MDKLRVAVIGCGQIAQTHFHNYASMGNDIELIAVCDINEQKANDAAQRFGAKHVYTDAREMLKRDDIDSVDVCVHNNKHAALTIMALEAGKNVYCEKPMAGTYADAVKMYETAKKCGKKLAIQLNEIFSTEARIAKKLIDAGELGNLYHARSVGLRRRGRPYVDGYGNPAFVNSKICSQGALFDMGVYHISQILYLLGNPEVASVSGSIVQKMPMDGKRKADSGFDVEEFGTGYVRMKNGVIMDIIEAWSLQAGSLGSSMVQGDAGGIQLSPFNFSKTIADMDFDCSINKDGAQFRFSTVNGEGDLYQGPQRHYICHQLGRVDLIPLAEIALNTMFISEGIVLSSKLGREVTAEEIIADGRTRMFKGDEIFINDNDFLPIGKK